MVTSLVNDHNHDINKVTSYSFWKSMSNWFISYVYKLYVDTTTLAIYVGKLYGTFVHRVF